MTQPAETAPRTMSYDPWDQASSTMWFVHIDPDTLEGLWSEEQETLYINQDEHGYWLSEPGVMGQSCFDTLDEAKAAGNEILLKAEDDLPAKMLADGGLDPSVWSFEYREGARFRHLQDESLVIEVDIESSGRSHRFGAMSGSDEVGDYATAAEAADALVNSPAPGI